MRIALWLLLAVLFARPAQATFSIVAIDPATGELGVALGSMAFGASERVPFGQGGVGAIATQSNNNVGYQMRSLELLKSGLTAQQVVEKLLAEDMFPGKEGRQFALIDAKGNIAVHMGANTAQPRGVRQRPTYAVIGNNLLGAHVVDAVGGRLREQHGRAGRTALRGGEGGRARGRRSRGAAIGRHPGVPCQPVRQQRPLRLGSRRSWLRPGLRVASSAQPAAGPQLLGRPQLPSSGRESWPRPSRRPKRPPNTSQSSPTITCTWASCRISRVVMTGRCRRSRAPGS